MHKLAEGTWKTLKRNKSVEKYIVDLQDLPVLPLHLTDKYDALEQLKQLKARKLGWKYDFKIPPCLDL
jgi:hypothetical protein